MTREEAEKLCRLIPRSAYTREAGYSSTANDTFAESLREAFPDFNWRVILDRSGERTRWRLTVDDNDPREHFFHLLGGKCIHCGKTALDLKIEHDESNTEEEELIHALSQRA
jgi:hypothetical protein